jgi:hypothetical protein
MLRREKVNKVQCWLVWGNIRPGGVGLGYRICHHVCPIAAPINYTRVVDHIAGSGANTTRLKVRVMTKSLLSDVS